MSSLIRTAADVALFAALCFQIGCAPDIAGATSFPRYSRLLVPVGSNQTEFHLCDGHPLIKNPSSVLAHYLNRRTP